MASPNRSRVGGEGSSRTPSRTPARSGAEGLAAALSARLGDLLLTEKEATGLVVKRSGVIPVPWPK
jgi:hypothetical protein